MATKYWKSAKFISYSEPQQTLDPFGVKSLPSEYQLSSWKQDILNNGSMKWRYIETSLGRLDTNCIDILLKLHTAKGIQAAVEQEMNWFSRTYNKPQTVSQHPPASLIANFQNMLYSNRYDEIRQPHLMSANELAMVCANRWISSDHICWMMKTLTDSQVDTYCIFLNGVLGKDPTTLRRFRSGNTDMPLPSKFVFVINVGRNETGIFFGTDHQQGCHWTLCHVDIAAKKIVYGDSLAWPAPNGLLSKVDRYLKAVCKDDDVSNYSVAILHDPTSKCPKSGFHRCGGTCAQFYPLQTCSSICGIVVMVAAAIACHNLEFFQHISTAHGHATKSFPPVFLQTPSRFGKYLRLAVASWIAGNAVNTEHVIPQLWKQCQQQHPMFSSSSTPNAHHDHDYCSESTKDGSGKGERSMVVISDDDDDDDDERTTTTASPSSDDNMQHNCPVTSTKKAMNGGPAKEKKYECVNCDSSFTRKFTLRRHIRTKHPKQQLDGNCICHDCGFKCHRIGDLRKHLTRAHNILFRSEQLVLENMTGEY